MNRILSLPLLLLLACTGEMPETPTPQTGDCVDDVCVLSGILTEDLTLTADKQWLLRGGVFIGDDVNSTTLTVEPGTTVYGESSTDGMLVVTRHSRIVADGTAEAPIVFTSSKAEGSRARGDWGGLVLNGLAPINSCSDTTTECEAFGEGGTGWYGGNAPTDDSGVLRYVRVEFAGTLVSPENELNGIAFQGVGSGTTVNHIQVHMNADDGIEFFGGTAQVKHVLVTGVGDDALDWTDGWQGKAQFVVLQQYDDASGDNGIEADNNAENNDAQPRSNPTLSNVTIIGSPESDTSDYGMLLREGTAGTIRDTVVVGFNDACLDIDHSSTFAGLGTELTFEGVHLDCATLFEQDDETGPDPVDIELEFFSDGSNHNSDGGLMDPFNLTAPDFGCTTTGTTSSSDPFFEVVDHVGGMGADDWTAGWTTAARN